MGTVLGKSSDGVWGLLIFKVESEVSGTRFGQGWSGRGESR